MPGIDEIEETRKPDLGAALAAGVNTLDLKATFVFDLYDRRVLPLDGYIFWLKRLPTVVNATQLTVEGSMHIATVNTQDEAANISQTTVKFTALAEVNSLIEVDPSTMWIVTIPEGPFEGLKVAFSSQGGFYKVADLFHYVGHALYADLETQIIDDPADLPSALIVSNSLPIWLLLSNFVPVFGGPTNPFTLYPSFLVPDDLDPRVTPYGAVHIPEDQTTAIQSTPLITADSSHYQLASDHVTVTLYGGTNEDALNFLDCVLNYSRTYDTMGIQNMPIVRDAKRPQAEFSILAMKKTVVFDVSYEQANLVDIGRQLIRSATCTLLKPA